MSADTHRGWSISRDPDGWLHATSPNYDASYEGPEDGWVDNGERCSARTRAELVDEIDEWIAERAPARPEHPAVSLALWAGIIVFFFIAWRIFA